MVVYTPKGKSIETNFNELLKLHFYHIALIEINVLIKIAVFKYFASLYVYEN